MTGSSIAIEKLLSRIDRIGIRSRTAVSKSMPVKPMAASPQTLMQSFSGRGELGAHREPEPVAQLRGLAPPDVRQRRRAPPERRELVARAARVVGDDRVRDVDRRLQVAQITRYGLSGLESSSSFGTPVLQPRLVAARDLGGDRLAPSARRTAEPLPHRLDQHREGQLRVADERVLGPGRPCSGRRGPAVAWMTVLSLGNGIPKPRRAERAPDAEHHVAVPQEVDHRLRVRAAARAERQRVGLGERALALEAGRDRRPPAARRAPAAPATPSRSGRPGRRRSPGGRPRRARPLRRRPRPDRARTGHRGRLVVGIRRERLRQHVVGQLDEHGARAAVADLGERAAQRRRRVRRLADVLDRPS